MRYPFDEFRLGTRYGTRGSLWKCGWHSGLDLLSANYGGDGLVYPLYAGAVQKVAYSAAYGNYVLVSHPDGYVTLYAHLKKVLVKKDMRVTENVALGYEGATGNVTGRHLHIEVHKGAYSYPAAIDPLAFIKERVQTMKKLDIKLNGVVKTVAAIECGGNNYVKLQDLRDDCISIGYDAEKKLPTVSVRK